MGDTQFIFVGIQTYLTMYTEWDDFSQHEMATLMLQKIKSYWNIMDKCSIKSAVLDPRSKLLTFSDELVLDARAQFKLSMRYTKNIHQIKHYMLIKCHH